MATFSAYQYHPFLLESVFLPNTPFNDHQVFENQTPPNLVTNTSTFGSDQFHDPFPDFNNSQKQCNDLLIHDQSSTVVDTNHLENSDHQVTQDTNLPIANYNDKKRMFKNDSTVSSLNSSDHSKIDAAHGKSKRGRKNSSKTETEEKKDKKRSPDSQEPPTGYIHVRARRGQATDSHSLAERVRREKISERMKILQSLVPGCDKVTGKALMLDEIINYVQSLQNQVEFLSMKLASLSPILYDFGMDLDHALMMRSTERVNSNSIASLLPPSVLQASVQQCSSSRSPTTQTTTAFGVDHQPNPTNNTITTTTNFISPNNFPILVTNNNNNSPSFLVHGHKPNTNNLAQGSHGAMWDMGEQRQKFLNQSIVGTNLCSFQQI